MAGRTNSASHAPPPMKPAMSGATSQPRPATRSTASDASRQARYKPPCRQVCASKTSGEIQAMKRRM
jgi:hypothetical protein